MLLYEEIKQVHVEPSQKCQASCPMCDRNKNGGEVNQYLTNADLSLEDVKKIFPKPFVKQLHNMYFCGNHGDPIFCPELYEICKWLKEVNPSISLSITTNGGARGVAWWTKIAKVVNQVIFSVDGLEDTNHLYRQGVAWKNVEANMEAFCDAGGKAIWTFLVFRHNEHQVEEARGWAKMIGVQEFIVKKSGRYISTATLEKKKTHQAIDRWGVDTKLLEQPISIGYQNKASSQYDNVVAKFGSMDNYLDVANIN